MTKKAGLQKVTVPLESLPPLKVIDANTLGYYVRYRIASQDKNKLSHWSPTYLLTANFDFRRPEGVLENQIQFFETNTGANQKVLTLSWEPVDVFIEDNYIRKAIAYDIWIKWGNENWEYKQRTPSTSLTIVRPTPVPNPATLSMEIYARSIDITRGADHQQLLLYKRDNMAV